MIFKILLYFCLFNVIFCEFLPGCIKLICHNTLNTTSQLQKVRACDDCRNLKSK